MIGKIRLVDTGLNQMVDELYHYNRSTMPRTINRVGLYIAQRAIKYVAKPGPERVSATLMRRGRKQSHGIRFRGTPRKSKIADEFRGTFAASIIGAKIARGELPRPSNAAEFWRRVRNFVNTKRRSSGYHRWGMWKVVEGMGARPDDPDLRRVRIKPGRSYPATENNHRAILINFGPVISQLSPDAWDKAVAETKPLIERMIAQSFDEFSAGLNRKRK